MAITTYAKPSTTKVDDDSKEFMEFNKKLRDHGFKMWRSPYKTSFTTDDMQEYVNKYFNLCDEYGQLPSVKGLCLYIGITTQMFSSVTNNPESGYHPIFCGAKDYIHSVLENRAMNGKVSSSVYSFTAQNFYDMSSTQKVDISTNNTYTLNIANSEETILALKQELEKQNKVLEYKEVEVSDKL